MNTEFTKGPILVTGSQGLLGSEFIKKLKDFLPDSKIISTSHQELDISDPGSVSSFIQKLKPYWVINCAAYTQVDLAESERDKAFAVNVKGPMFLAEECEKQGAKLIHFSTDYVFSGKGNEPWSETDLTEPVEPNWYGKTKLLGEKAVLEKHMNLVCRVQWLYGSHLDRFSGLKNKTKFTPFSDQFGAPTWARDVVNWTWGLLNQDAEGVFHLAYDDYTNWYEVYDFVKKKWNLKVDLVPSKLQQTKLPASRPLNGRLSNKKMLACLELKSAGSWKDSLNTFLEEKSQ